MIKEFKKTTLLTQRENNTFNLEVNKPYNIKELLTHNKFINYEPKLEILNKIALKKGLNLTTHKNLIKVLAYTQNINKGHTFFYKGINCELGFMEENLKEDVLKEFLEFQINTFIFTYNIELHKKRNKNSTFEVVKNV